MEEKWMKLALSYAKKCKTDVPVGAVIVHNGKVIGYGYNQKERYQDSTCHAEIMAIRRASKKMGRFILENCEMYVTLEPCMMCYGAIASARIDQVFFGAYNEKYSTVFYCDQLPFNHKTHYVGGVLEEECQQILQEFFKKVREEHGSNKSKNKRKNARIRS